MRDYFHSRHMVQLTISSLLLSKFVSVSILHLFQVKTRKSRRPDSRRLRPCAGVPKQAGDPGSKLAVSSGLCVKVLLGDVGTALPSSAQGCFECGCGDFPCTLTCERAFIYLVLPYNNKFNFRHGKPPLTCLLQLL